MNGAAVRIAAAHADTADLTPAGDWALVSGVPCQHVALPHPWATTGRVLARPTLPGADTLARVAAGELAARYSDLVWLHCTPASRALYERLGYHRVDDHVLLVRTDFEPDSDQSGKCRRPGSRPGRRQRRYAVTAATASWCRPTGSTATIRPR